MVGSYEDGKEASCFIKGRVFLEQLHIKMIFVLQHLV
jgi:hypothetical protein